MHTFPQTFIGVGMRQCLMQFTLVCTVYVPEGDLELLILLVSISPSQMLRLQHVPPCLMTSTLYSLRLNFYYFLVIMYICVRGLVCASGCSTRRGQKKVLGLLQLELHASIVGCWELTCWAISPAYSIGDLSNTTQCKRCTHHCYTALLREWGQEDIHKCSA